MDILHIYGITKQRRNVCGEEAGNATANGRDEEGLVGMGFGVRDKLVDIRTDGIHTTLHRWDGIALSLRTITITHYGTEMQTGRTGSATAVHTGKVTAENKDFIGLKLGDILRRDTV